MTEPLQRIFFVDDRGWANALGPQMRRLLGEGLEVRAFTNVEDLLQALRAGEIPDAVCFDASLNDDDARWGQRNAQAVILWFQMYAPARMPRYFMFMSLDAERALNSAQQIHDMADVRTFGFDKDEIDLAEDLATKSSVLRDNHVTTISFRKFLQQVTGLNLPMTKEEMIAYKISNKIYNHESLVRMVHEGYFDRDEALRILYRDAVEEASTRLRPRARISGDAIDLALCFSEAAGRPAKGYAAFTLQDVEKLALEGKESILFLEEYSADFIPHLKTIAGVVLMNPNASGHMALLLNAHGTAGALGLHKIGEHFPFLRTPEGKKILYGAQIDLRAGERVFTNYITALSTQADAHWRQYRKEGQTEDEAMRDAPPLTVDVGSLFAQTIRFGDPVTINVDDSGAAALVPGHLEIRAGSQLSDWASYLSGFLEEWRAERGIPTLAFKVTIDYPQQSTEGARKIGLLRTEHFIMKSAMEMTAFKRAVLEQAEVGFESLRTNLHCHLRSGYFYPAVTKDDSMRIRLVDLPPAELFTATECARIGELYGDPALRGVQMAMALPRLYEAQLHGIFSALRASIEEESQAMSCPPGDVVMPALEIMVPTVRRPEELIFVKDMTARIAAEYGFGSADYRFGSMLETKEAGAHIEDIVPHCDFISIGSNDASSEILGYERENFDDRHWIMTRHFQLRDPALTLYPPVVAWIIDVVTRARAVRPDLQVDLCGGHAADLDSLNALRPARLNGVSVTPTRHNLTGLKLRYDYETFMRAQAEKPMAAMKPAP